MSNEQINREPSSSHRSAFEKWISSPPYERDLDRWPMDETKHAWPGQYLDDAVQIAWEAWQEASGVNATAQELKRRRRFKMTDEAINRAVADELGYGVSLRKGDRGETLFVCFSPCGDSTAYKTEREAWEGIPDFCTDHNAADELRLGIKEEERLKFVNQLMNDIEAESCWDAIDAEPRQQAEAFLRMRGKWRE